MGRLQNPHTTLLVSIHFNCYTKNIHTLHCVVKAVLAPCLLKEYLSSNIIALPNILILDILCANVIWVLVYHWNGWQFGEARIYQCDTHPLLGDHRVLATVWGTLVLHTQSRNHLLLEGWCHHMGDGWGHSPQAMRPSHTYGISRHHST